MGIDHPSTLARTEARLAASKPKSDYDAMLLLLAQNVLAVRAERGTTRRQMAEETGLSERFLADVEKGRANPSLRSLEALAQFSGRSVAVLVSTPRQISPRLGSALAALTPEAQGRLADELLARAAQTRGATRVALVGLRGAGKTTVGRLLAKRLRCRFVELDRLIEEAAGLALAQVFEVHGEAYYRRLEREVLQRTLAGREDLVIATGGGLVVHEETWALLREGTRTVWLKARAEEYLARVLRQGDRRPVDRRPNALAELRALLAAREPAYRLAEFAVDTSPVAAEEVAERIAAWVKAKAE